MKVCIAEKPSVAREIAVILGANQRHDGYFEGGGYQVTWTFGHLCTLFAPDDYKPHWKRWDLNTLPMLPEKFDIKLTSNSGVQKQFNTIKKLFDAADVVINCGDAGQEGELIQRWVLKQANYTGPVSRLWISSLTSEAIKAGFKNLKDAKDYDNLFYAGSSRAIGDWLLGMNATRLYTLRYGAQKQVLSVGRVQTPTLAMLVNRHKEIVNFKPQPYWELQTLYRGTTFNNEQGRFLKKEAGQNSLEAIQDQPFEIVAVQKKKGKEYAPKLFDLTGLQVHCNTKFGYTADQTLKIVQKLYEQKLVTYPRVDTTFLPNDLYPKIHGILSRLTKYASLTTPLLGQKIKKSTKVFDDKKVTDHHAIIPTGIEAVLGEFDQHVYDSISRRFIAVFYPECQVSNTTVQGEVAKINFKASGKEILDAGWRVVFAKAKTPSTQDAEEKTMPTFVKGESGTHQPSFLEKETKAPKNFTEATLLRSMETAGKDVEEDELRDLMKANGIGRPSTRANIIETLFRRQYVVRKKKLILPTHMGIQLIDTIQNKLLKSATLTGQWEKQLKEIEQGEYSATEFIGNMKKMVDDLVVEVRMEKNIRRFSNEPKAATPPKKQPKASALASLKCPKCSKGTLLKGTTAYGCSEYKSGCSFRMPFEFMGKKISVNQFKRLVNKGATVRLKGFQKDGEKCSGTVRFNTSFELDFLPQKENATTKNTATLSCPKCKRGTVLKGSTAYGCSEHAAGCDFRVSFELIRSKAMGRPLDKDLVAEILKTS
jgi:DNA topoisomerase-3